jgi:hypothetical protein
LNDQTRGQGLGLDDRTRRGNNRRARRDLELGYCGEELLNRGLQFATSQMHSHAAMRTEGERVMHEAAIEADLVGLIVFHLVATGQRSVPYDAIARHDPHLGDLDYL